MIRWDEWRLNVIFTFSICSFMVTVYYLSIKAFLFLNLIHFWERYSTEAWSHERCLGSSSKFVLVTGKLISSQVIYYERIKYCGLVSELSWEFAWLSFDFDFNEHVTLCVQSSLYGVVNCMDTFPIFLFPF